jgi:putative Holliday junction resolvase
VNYLGIDLGQKRTGVSIFHGDVRIVLPMEAIVTTDDDVKIQKICEIVKRDRIDEIVIGYPLNADGSIGKKANEINNFAAKLSQQLPKGIKISFFDERFTSEQAAHSGTLAYGGQSPAKKQKQRKLGVVDSLSAAVILQEFLNELKL